MVFDVYRYTCISLGKTLTEFYDLDLVSKVIGDSDMFSSLKMRYLLSHWIDHYQTCIVTYYTFRTTTRVNYGLVILILLYRSKANLKMLNLQVGMHW